MASKLKFSASRCSGGKGKPKIFRFTVNSAYLDKVLTFFGNRGFRPIVEVMKDPPASGVGQLCKVSVKGFNPFKLDPDSLREWGKLL